MCASVRVRILQELVLTRDAFTARLEIENGENSDLQNIKVQIEIRPTYRTATSYIDKFSIGNVLSLNRNMKILCFVCKY